MPRSLTLVDKKKKTNVQMCYGDVSCIRKKIRINNVAQTLDFELIFSYTRGTIAARCDKMQIVSEFQNNE